MSITVHKNVPLASHATFKVGGDAEYFVTADTEEDLVEAVSYAQVHQLPIRILAGGSNVLVDDTGVRGLVIHLKLKGVEAQEESGSVLLTASAGENLDELVALTVEKGWWGIENFSHIPGTVGATPIQNVGAYGVEASDVIESVRVYDIQTETFLSLPASVCAFGYRDSLFKHEEGKRYIVTAVTYVLSTTANPQIGYRDLAQTFEGSIPTQNEIREAVMKIRAGKFPDWTTIGTAGSFFKNPIISAGVFEELRTRFPELPAYAERDGAMKISLGWVLDKVLGLRGFTQGNVSLYKDQALVVVADEGATASEIETFANDIVEKIKKEVGIDVQWEVTKMR